MSLFLSLLNSRSQRIQKVCEVMLVLYLVGSCIAYMTVMGDIIGPVARHWAGNFFFDS